MSLGFCSGIPCNYCYDECQCSRYPCVRSSCRQNEFCFYCHFKGDKGKWADYVMQKAAFRLLIIAIKAIIAFAVATWLMSKAPSSLTAGAKAGLYGAAAIVEV
ncbi:hypothetical protein M3Y99_00148500 [Aphelenchoides fujianensis]|nr:hypothetical protein M3Y99_00148500 [Aphelenchoides fujianensis]